MNKKSEKFTENLVEKEMNFDLGENDFGYVYPQGNVKGIDKLNKLLQKAGGKPKKCELNNFEQGGAGKAKPEYIITFNDDPNTILVIECKSHTKFHKTEKFNQPKSYAIDGVLYYAKFLKDEFNVIAIGVSGTNKEKYNLDVYYWYKGQDTYAEQTKLHNIFLDSINYLKAMKGEKISKNYSLDEIRTTALLFHNKLREIKVSERHKPIFIAGILIALEDKDFAKSYSNLSSFSQIITQLNKSIDTILTDSDIKKPNIDNIKNAFSVIGTSPKLKSLNINEDGSIRWYIEQLEMKIKPMMNNADFSLDALGVFYHEFIKYSGGDGKGLGIVLTPQHLTEFMCDLAKIDINSYVIDICCGSASFLISAMNKMFSQTADPNILSNIKKHQLYGIELDSELYVLAIANMIIRKDGKSNIIHGDCFQEETIKELKKISRSKLNVGLLNPPYSQKDIEELEFVEQLLSILNKNGLAVVVVPMSCAIGTKFKKTRERLFEKHTLKAVFSMPNDIFHTTKTSGTQVCVMVWEAHTAHDSTATTFFGYYKDDGFVKRKKLGRIDAYNKWNDIKNQWLSLYKNSEEKDGLSVKKCVRHNDEWLCEAYMKTDYSKLTQADFEKSIRNYLAYLVKNGIEYED